MSKFNSFYRFFTLSLVIFIIAAGCTTPLIPQTGEMTTENHSVDLGAATSAHVQIEMDLGELSINNGAAIENSGATGNSGSKLMEGTFDYNVPGWHPEVNYTIDGSQGTLLINQPDSDQTLVNQGGQNRWNLQLSEKVPIDLEISTGAGNSEINLSAMDLTHLKIETGAGSGTIDLTGTRNQDLNVTIKGGVGNFTIFLPREMGVQANIKSGIGDVETSGFSQDGDLYTNDAFGKTSETLYLEIESGIGGVVLQLR